MPSYQSSGYFLYNQLHDDIERLVSMKAGLYSIPGFDREDIGQEIRLTCVRALEKWDPAKNNSTPFHFLARCVDNRLRNLLRDNGSSLSKIQKEDSRAIERADKKRKLQTALSVGDEVDEETLGFADSAPNIAEFIDSIEQRLPQEVRCSFSLLIQCGPPAIPKKHLRVIKKVIRELYPGSL